jgi:hypothetical protein
MAELTSADPRDNDEPKFSCIGDLHILYWAPQRAAWLRWLFGDGKQSGHLGSFNFGRLPG